MNNKTLGRLVRLFSRLPGVGERTAKGIVLHLIQNKDQLLTQFTHSLTSANSLLRECSICKNVDETEKCSICADPKRNHNLLCIVESIIDLWAIEEANFYKGLYHVLGLASSSRTSQGINMNSLIERIEKHDIKEIIIATNATLDGQTAAFAITDRLRLYTAIRITRFAHGVPIGGELKYLDEVTLSTAFNSRQDF